jgi:hypothetical protein
MQIAPRLGATPPPQILLPLAVAVESNVGAGEPLAHFDRDGLAFDYPATWASRPGPKLNQSPSYTTILAYLGKGTALTSCPAVTPGLTDPGLEVECQPFLQIEPGQVVLQLSRADGQPLGPIDPSDPTGLLSGEKYVTIGGLPAIFEDAFADPVGTVALHWTFSVPGKMSNRYGLDAQIEGPSSEKGRAQVEALVASINYDPPAPVLNPSDGPRSARSGVEWAVSTDPGFSCFPTVPGTSSTATVTRLPFYQPLSKSLPVTCRTDIEASAALWRLTLTESWTAGLDRSAGGFTRTIWLEPDGTPGWAQGELTPAEVPYLP